MNKLLAFLKENRAYSETFGIFEIGHTVDGTNEDGTCREVTKLGAAFFSKALSEEDLFMHCRDIIAELSADILHKNAVFTSIEPAFDYMHPVNTFEVSVDGVKVGVLSVPHPTVLGNIDKKCAVAFFEIETAAFASVKVGKVKYAEPSKFPAIDIDLTFNADVSAINFASLTESAKAAAGELLADVKVKDIYTADGVTALTLRFSFVSAERTLSKQELQPATDAIIAELAKSGITFKG